jgi:hypothetical protein
VTFVIKVRSAIQARESQGFTLLFTPLSICYEILPKILLCHLDRNGCFLLWFYKLKRKEIKENEFTYHKNRGHQHYLAVLFNCN